KPGEESKVVVLTKKIKFSKVQMVKQTEKINQFIPTRWDGNRILNRYLPAQSEASELLRDFSGSFELRDAAVDKVGDRILAVQCADNSLWRYSNDIVSKKIDMMKLSLSEPLNSPEGVTADSHGHFYVADWGNHRVLKFNRDGVVTQVIGGFGANHPSDVGKPIKLVFPTRLVVLEDQEGVMVNGEAHFREPYLFLADHNGIHLCNLSGEYLDSLLLPSHALGPGSFYAFAVERNSRAVTLFLAKRTGNDEHKMFEFVAN
ncbi:MAG TPA: hypothetical protein VGA99_07275, partial [bacterium]